MIKNAASAASPADKTKMITTEAWVIYASEDRKAVPLKLEEYSFPDIGAEEVLVAPLYGCWEGNMSHALQCRPVDICKQRREQKVVIGNAGVVRVLRTGAAVTTVKEGDNCIVFPNAVWDDYGYPLKILAYDAPNTMGVLAKQSKMHQKCVIPIPSPTNYSLKRWAAFSLRYCTAWANWNIAHTCWRSQMPDVNPADIHVWGWGGGVSMAELTLAKHLGFQTAMISSSERRMKQIKQFGIQPIDRSHFADLYFDPNKYERDEAYKKRYIEAEHLFLEQVKEHTNGKGVSIFIDNVGQPVFRATVKALARQGVITTCGWKEGMKLSLYRAIEAINRHTYVHTHFARYAEGCQAVKEAEEWGWMAPDPVTNGNKIYNWDEIPALAANYEASRVNSYYPIFKVNPSAEE